jgi:hypothetical protein
MLQPWTKVSIIDAGRFDKDTAYAAINTLRLDDNRPHILRTHDGGKTWKEIVRGIPDGQTINVVREDPVRKGLLYAGSERQVYVSFDDGENWQSLRVNMPATSVRDLIVKGDDLAIATHGRGFWILDNVTPLRQIAAARETRLFEPQTAWRIRWNLNSDTPLPPDEPFQENPPDGAAIDYYLASDAKNVELEIRDPSGRVVRTYRNTDTLPEVKDIGNWPAYWQRRPQALASNAGGHRFLWDMRYAPIPGVPPEYPIAANYMNTAPVPTSPLATPGKYKAVLRVDGREYVQSFDVMIDPRARANEDDLKKQFDLSMQLYELRMRLEPANAQLAGLAKQLNAAKKNAAPAVAAQIDAFVAKLAAVSGSQAGGDMSFGVLDRISQIFGVLQQADAAPTVANEATARDLIKKGSDALTAWDSLVKNDLPGMQTVFKQNNLPELKLTAAMLDRRFRSEEEDEVEEQWARP